jgi:hypothetical protein
VFQEESDSGRCLRYSGTYNVSEDKIVHKIDASRNESWTGTEQVRFYNVVGRTLTITTAVNRNPSEGREGQAVLVFTKVQ